jgi:hypothetical protein
VSYHVFLAFPFNVVIREREIDREKERKRERERGRALNTVNMYKNVNVIVD